MATNNEIGIKLTLSGEQQVKTALAGVEDRMDSLTGAVSRAGHYGAAFLSITQGLIPVAQAAVRAADSVTTLNNQLRLATGSTQAASKAYLALFDIAQSSRVSFTELGGTFASISRAGQELGLSQQRLLGVTEAIGNAMTISGGNAESMNAALVQLGQGLASGTLRGEELNSVMEQTPRLAKAIADGLGVPIGKLRDMGAAGEISAQQVIRALEAQSAVLRGEVAGSVLTVGQAMTQLQNAATKTVGDLDQATGASSTLASSLSVLAAGIGTLGQVAKDNEVAIKAVLGGVAVGAAIGGYAALASNIGKITAAVRLLGMTLSANPVVLALMGLGALYAGVSAAAEARSKTLDGMRATLRELESLEKRGNTAMYGTRVSDEVLAKRREDIKRLRAEIALLDNANLDTRAEDARMAAMVKSAKAADADREAYANLSRTLSGFKGNYKEYTDNVALIKRLRESGAISEKEAAQRLGELAKQHGLAAKEVKANKEAERELAEQRKHDLKVGELRNQQIDDRLKFEAELAKQQAAVVAQEYESADATNAQALARELANDKTVDATLAMQQLTLAQLEQQRLDLEATDNVIPGYIQALEARIAAQKRLIAATQTGISQEASDKVAKESEEAWRKSVEKIEDVFRDGFAGMLNNGKAGWSAFTKSLSTTFKTAVANEIYKSLAKPFVVQVIASLAGVTGLSSVAGVANAATGGGGSLLGTASSAANLANLTGLGSTLGALGAGVNAFSTAMVAGAQSMVGISGTAAQMATSLSQAGYWAGSSAATAASTAGASLGASAAAAAPYVLAAYAAIKVAGLDKRWGGDPDAYLVQSAAGKSQPYQQSASTAFGQIGFANGSADILKNGSWIREYGETENVASEAMKGTLDAFTALDSAIAATLSQGEIAKVAANLNGWYRKSWSFEGDMLGDWMAGRYREVFASIDGELGTLFEQLSFDGAALPGVVDLFVALNSGAKNIAGMTQEVGRLMDGTSAYTRAGETAAQTVTRLSSSLTSVNAALDVLGSTLYQVSLGGADMAQQLVDMMGGMAQYQATTTAYYQAYYTEAERAEVATRQLTASLSALGLDLPATREAYRDLVEAQDLTTDAGRRTYAALLGLSAQFDSITPKLDTLAGKFGSLVAGLSDEATRLIDSQIQLSQDAASAARDASSAYRGAMSDLRAASESILRSRIGGQQSAQMAYRSQLVRAQGGDIDAMKALPDLADALLAETKSNARTAVDFAIASAQVANQLEGVAAVADVLGVGADYQANLYDVNTSLLEVTREQLASGNLTVDLLQEISAALGYVDQSIQNSANLTVGVMRTGNGGIVGALVDNAGNVVAGLNSTTVLQLVGMQNQMAAAAAQAQAMQAATWATAGALGNTLWGTADWQRQAAYDVNNSQWQAANMLNGSLGYQNAVAYDVNSSQHQLGWATAGALGNTLWGTADWQRQAAYDVNNSQWQAANMLNGSLGYQNAVAYDINGSQHQLGWATAGALGNTLWGTADWQRQAAYDVNNSQWQAANMLNGSLGYQNAVAYDINGSQHQLGWATAGALGNTLWGTADWQRQAAYDVNNSQWQAANMLNGSLGYQNAVAYDINGSQHQLGWATAGALGNTLWGTADWQRQAAYDVNNSQWQAANMLNGQIYGQTVGLSTLNQQQIGQLQGLAGTQSKALGLTDIVASATDGSQTLLGAVLNRLKLQDLGTDNIVGTLNQGSVRVLSKLGDIEAAIRQNLSAPGVTQSAAQSASYEANLHKQNALSSAQSMLQQLANEKEQLIARYNQNQGGIFQKAMFPMFLTSLSELDSDMESARKTITGMGGVPAYSVGGYTGPGGLNEPAGIVHKGEVVWSQADVARAGGVQAAESLRRGGGPQVVAMQPVGLPIAVGALPGDGEVQRLLRELVEQNRRLTDQVESLSHEVDRFRQDNNAGNAKLADASGQQARVLRKWDVIGMPVATS